MSKVTRLLRSRLAEGGAHLPATTLIAGALAVLVASSALAASAPAPVTSSPRARPRPSASPTVAAAFTVARSTGPSRPATAGHPLGIASKKHKTTRHERAVVHIDVSREGIPDIALRAYRAAAAKAASQMPDCHLTWEVLAGLGRIESDHGTVDAPPRYFTKNGTSLPSLRGPKLDGRHGTAALPDTDLGRLDGDTRWDRAVGPMQFLPSTWKRYGADGNSDGRADVDNVFDSAVAAAAYVCAGGRDLSDPRALAHAVFAYNHSKPYVKEVLDVIAQYSHIPTRKLIRKAFVRDRHRRHHHRHHGKHHHRKRHHHKGAKHHRRGFKTGAGGSQAPTERTSGGKSHPTDRRSHDGDGRTHHHDSGKPTPTPTPTPTPSPTPTPTGTSTPLPTSTPTLP